MNFGASGTQVTALANPGYHFVSWSDGVMSAARTDANPSTNISVTASFAINTVPPVAASPTLILSTLANGAVTNNATLNISGTVTDPSGVTSLAINTASVTIGVGGSFSTALTLQPGANIITSTAIDVLGNQTTDTRTINLDTTAPVLTAASPADNSHTAQVLMTVGGTINETSTVAVTVNNGAPQQASINGTSFTLEITLVPGINTIQITATDLAGNSSSVARTVTCLTTTPSLSITTPGQDITTAQNSLTLSGTASDTQSSVTVAVVLNGQTFIPAVTGGTFSQQLNLPAEGTYSVVATATDEAGNSASVTRTIIFALPVPNLAITAATTPTTSTSQTIAGTMDSGATISVSCPTASLGTVTYPSATTWQVTVTGMQTGNNVFSVKAVSSQGKTSLPTSTTILVNDSNSTPPAITAFELPTVASTTSVTLTSLTVSNSAEVTGYYLSESNAVPAASASGWLTVAPQSYSFSSAGAKTLYLWIKNAAGSVSGPASATVIVGGSTATAHDGIVNPAKGKTTPDITDALLTLKYVTNLDTLNATQLASADVAPLGLNGKPMGKGTVNISDVIMILRRSIGVVSW